jgi:hypothetical protein
MDALLIAAQVVGRMFDPIGWIVMLGLFFAFRAGKLPAWAPFIGAATIGGVVIQGFVMIMISAEGRHPDFAPNAILWMLTGLVECGIAAPIAKGVRAMKSA